jgi:chromosome segregation ATPase
VADRVEFVYDVQGAAEGAEAVEALKTAMEQQAAAAGQAAEGQQTLEAASNDLTIQIEALRDQTEQLRASEQQHQASMGLLTGITQQTGQQFTQLTQRAQGVAGAIQGIVSAAGSSDRTAGAIASLAGLVAQGASLGAMFGPTGALVGGLIGAGAGILGLAEAHRTATPEIERTTVALREEAAAADEARVSLSDFLSSISTGARASAVAEEADRLSSMADEIVRLRSSASVSDRLRAETLAEEYRTASRDLDGRLADLRAEEAENAANRTRSGGGRRARPRTVEDILGTSAASNADIRAMGEAADTAARDAEAERAARERAEAEREALDEKERRTDELAALEDKRHQRKLQQIEQERDARARADAERARRLEQETRVLETFGNTVGGVFAGAFEAAITGQESFDAALLKGTKQALVQYGTTMVAEGIGALLTAAGNVIINPPAAASKAIEGAGKIALGVGLGAAGAAIPTPGAGGAPPVAERPESRAPAREGDGPAPIVLNMNGPTVMGGTHAEVGRNFVRAGRAAQQRFGGAV